MERLTAFAAEGEPREQRPEARTAIKLFEDRLARLERRENLQPAELTPLGMLMLVPEGA
jgi:hypothetical protein